MMKKIRIGMIGLGQRGGLLLKNTILGFDELDVTYVCDVYADRTDDAAEIVREKRGAVPKKTTDYREVLASPDVDAVYISTAWEYHVPIATDALRAGKITALEVGGAYEVDELWEMVRAYEETQTPFFFMENCCFGKHELLATALARKGVFGEISHCSGSYTHDLRDEILSGNEIRHYRLRNYTNRNCENYPTHELGPIAKLLDVNRGNRMTKLVAMSSKAAGLNDYAARTPKYDALKDVKFAQGDVVYTLISCANGESIALKLDTTLPSYYSRDFTVRGTRGSFEQKIDAVVLDGLEEKEGVATDVMVGKLLGSAEKYADDLPECWKNTTPEQIKAGHGGMDYIQFRVFIDTVLSGAESPIDVYDAASWMAVTCLSEKSIELGCQPMAIPDFTRGKWMMRPRLDVVKL